MTIVLIGPAYPLRGGIAHYLALLYVALKERGHQVDVLSLVKQYPKLLFPGKSQEDRSKEPLRIQSTPVLAPLNPISWIRTFWEVQKRKPDVILFKYWMPFFAPSYAIVSLLTKLFTPSAVLAICDNITPHEPRPGDRMLTWLGLRFVDHFIVQSDTVQKDLLCYVPNAHVLKVPHPIYDMFGGEHDKETARKRLGIQARRVVLFFGYVRAYKGLDILIQAMADVVREMEVMLIVAGEFYEDREPYDRQISELGLEACVRIVDDYIPNEEVGWYFSAADVVVLPYLSATQSGIVQIAYALDKPVIITDVGGLPEVVLDGKTGLVVPSRDSKRLARAILRFYREGLEELLSCGVRAEKRNYSWNRMVRAIETLASSPGCLR